MKPAPLLFLLLLLFFCPQQQAFAQKKKKPEKKIKINWKRSGRVGLANKTIYTFPNSFVIVYKNEKQFRVDYYTDSIKPVTRFVKNFDHEISISHSRAGNQIIVTLMNSDTTFQSFHFSPKAELLFKMALTTKQIRKRVKERTPRTDDYYPLNVVLGLQQDERNYHDGKNYYELQLRSATNKRVRGPQVRSYNWNGDSLNPGYRFRWAAAIPPLEITTYRFFHFKENQVFLYIVGSNPKNGRKESHLIRLNNETGEVIFDEKINAFAGGDFMLSNGGADANSDRFVFAGNYRTTIGHRVPDAMQDQGDHTTGCFFMAIDASNTITYKLLDYPDKPVGARSRLKSKPGFIFHTIYFHPEGRVVAVGELFSLVNHGFFRDILSPYNMPRLRIHQTDGVYRGLTEGMEVISFAPDLSVVNRSNLQEYNALQRWRIHWLPISDPNSFYLGLGDDLQQFGMQVPALTDSLTLSFVLINPNEGRRFLNKKQAMGVYRFEATPSLATIEQIGKFVHHEKKKVGMIYKPHASAKKRLWVVEPISGPETKKLKFKNGRLRWVKKIKYPAQMQLFKPKPPVPGAKLPPESELKKEEEENIFVEPAEDK